MSVHGDQVARLPVLRFGQGAYRRDVFAEELIGTTNGDQVMSSLLERIERGKAVMPRRVPLYGTHWIGKAQPWDAKVLTPRGFVNLGELKVGDEVIGSDGQAHRVLGVYPQGEKEVFRVTFRDGSSRTHPGLRDRVGHPGRRSSASLQVRLLTGGATPPDGAPELYDSAALSSNTPSSLAARSEARW